MGCCVQTQERIIIRSSDLSLSYQESLEYEKENKNKNNKTSSIVNNKPIQRIKKESNKTSDLIVLKEKNKIEKKYLKTMNVLKEISYNEVSECTKFF